MTTLTNDIGTSAFSVETRASGVKILWLNVPGKVNVLKMSVLQELDHILDRLANDPGLKGLIIASARKGVFIAGADINEIRYLQGRGEEETYEVTMEAKRILAKLRTLGVPSVAAIDGACKGGGLELALWCSKRIASDSLDVALALPEVRLGIFPGFGGCVLLPRLIDTIKAVTMIAGGSDVGAVEAWRSGLLDEVAPRDKLMERAEALALGGKARRAPPSKQVKRNVPFGEKAVAALLDVTEPMKGDRFSGLRRFVGGVTHGVAGKQVLAQIGKRSRGYAAPLKAASFVLKALTMPLDKALKLESALFAQQVQTTESANLVSLFLDRGRAKKLAGSVEAAPFAAVAVIGSGIMGREIAFECIYSDQIEKVVLVDIKQEFLERGRDNIARLMAGRVKSGKLSQSAAEEKMTKLTLSTSYDALSDCDAVIEAVPEQMEIKLATFKKIDEVMAGRTYSNTSALDLDKLAEGVANPARFSGLHFFNPVSQMAGVEIPVTADTSPETMATAIAMVSALGKIPLPCKNHPGFIVNAILGPYLVMTAHLLAMGVAPAAIDKAILNFGMPMGPVELMDYVGLDVVASVAGTLFAAHGERLALPEVDFVGKLVSQGWLGRKSGHGFYVWSDDKTFKDEKTRKPVLSTPFTDLVREYNVGSTVMAEEAIVKLLIGVIENEAVRVLEAGVVSDPFLIDLAFVVSTGFTASLGGPLRHIDQMGVKTFTDLSLNIATGADLPGQSWRKNFVPCALLLEHAESRTNIYPPASSQSQ
ncbi:MAG: enoyl-CoA hydratase/isomerase family protein [Cyanobacteria bacterium SZAS LIN-3]|nr:enoyl-CoA hydratase/isomerase family protein [Cyanobacteria bacterium SZAS LIN-3]